LPICFKNYGKFENPPDSFPRTTRKSYGKDTKGRNPTIGGFRRDKDRIRLTSYLGKPERVMERIPREETPRLGIFKGIRIESAGLPSSDNSKGLWKGYQGKKYLEWGFPKG